MVKRGTYAVEMGLELVLCVNLLGNTLRKGDIHTIPLNEFVLSSSKRAKKSADYAHLNLLARPANVHLHFHVKKRRRKRKRCQSSLERITCVHMSLLVLFRHDSISSRIFAEAARSACERRMLSSENLAHEVGIVTLKCTLLKVLLDQNLKLKKDSIKDY